MKVGIYNTTDGGGRRFEACRELFEGVRYLSTTSAGFDHYNLEAMKKYGIRGANVPQYSPNAVSEHTVLLTLAALRKLRQQFSRTENRDYRTDGLMARELRSMTAGIIGCGRIGMTTIRCLSGFGLKKLYASDPFEREDVRQFAEYASPETLYRECDIILFHAAATSENYHMINDAAIASMKKGMLLVNCARGQLFDLDAVIRGLESGPFRWRSVFGSDILKAKWVFRRLRHLLRRYLCCGIQE